MAFRIQRPLFFQRAQRLDAFKGIFITSLATAVFDGQPFLVELRLYLCACFLVQRQLSTVAVHVEQFAQRMHVDKFRVAIRAFFMALSQLWQEWHQVSDTLEIG